MIQLGEIWALNISGIKRRKYHTFYTFNQIKLFI